MFVSRIMTLFLYRSDNQQCRFSVYENQEGILCVRISNFTHTHTRDFIAWYIDEKSRISSLIICGGIKKQNGTINSDFNIPWCRRGLLCEDDISMKMSLTYQLVDFKSRIDHHKSRAELEMKKEILISLHDQMNIVLCPLPEMEMIQGLDRLVVWTECRFFWRLQGKLINQKSRYIVKHRWIVSFSTNFLMIFRDLLQFQSRFNACVYWHGTFFSRIYWNILLKRMRMQHIIAYTHAWNRLCIIFIKFDNQDTS